MSVPLPRVTATVLSEYAATQINFSRSVQPDADSHYVAVFGASIAYGRTDYVVDQAGNKTNIVQRVQPGMPMPPGPYVADLYYGAIQLTPAQIAELGAIHPTTDLLSAIAEAADDLIHADLISREIL